MDFQRRDVNFGPLCHVATWISNVATSILSVSVTSGCGFPTSRREIVSSLSRRDVDFQRRDVKLYLLCHVATWISNVATWILMSLWNVVTLLIPLSVTSRRWPERRDAGCSTLYNVATLPRTSRRCPVLRPTMVHFSLHLAHTYTPPKPSLLHT